MIKDEETRAALASCSDMIHAANVALAALMTLLASTYPELREPIRHLDEDWGEAIRAITEKIEERSKQ